MAAAEATYNATMNPGKHYYSVGYLADLLQWQVHQVTGYLKARGVEPAFTLNDLRYYDAATVGDDLVDRLKLGK